MYETETSPYDRVLPRWAWLTFRRLGLRKAEIDENFSAACFIG